MFELKLHLHQWCEDHKLTVKEAAKLLRLNQRTLEGYAQGRRKLTDLAREGLLARMREAEKELKRKKPLA